MVNPFCAKTRDYSFQKTRRHRVKFTIREKAAYIKLARLGQSVNNIASLFMRSPSVIQRVLKRQLETFGDLRKLPRTTRERAALIQRDFMEKLGEGWLRFASSQEDKPP